MIESGVRFHRTDVSERGRDLGISTAILKEGHENKRTGRRPAHRRIASRDLARGHAGRTLWWVAGGSAKRLSRKANKNGSRPQPIWFHGVVAGGGCQDRGVGGRWGVVGFRFLYDLRRERRSGATSDRVTGAEFNDLHATIAAP